MDYNQSNIASPKVKIKEKEASENQNLLVT